MQSRSFVFNVFHLTDPVLAAVPLHRADEGHAEKHKTSSLLPGGGLAAGRMLGLCGDRRRAAVGSMQPDRMPRWHTVTRKPASTAASFYLCNKEQLHGLWSHSKPSEHPGIPPEVHFGPIQSTDPTPLRLPNKQTTCSGSPHQAPSIRIPVIKLLQPRTMR